MDLSTLQKQHGDRLAEIFTDPAFVAVRNYIESNHAFLQVDNVSPEAVKTNGEIRFAQLQGFLAYANELDTFMEKKALTEFDDLGAPSYPDPLNEITVQKKNK